MEEVFTAPLNLLARKFTLGNTYTISEREASREQPKNR